MPDDGTIIVNTGKCPGDIRKELGISSGIKVFTVDASGISKETIGREIPNTPMLGAFVKATGMLDFKEMLDDTRKKLEKKFKNKPGVAEGNIKAIERAYAEVRS
jgi:pyruvate ferredoxin oxidoreductase gamma subunit